MLPAPSGARALRHNRHRIWLSADSTCRNQHTVSIEARRTRGKIRFHLEHRLGSTNTSRLHHLPVSMQKIRKRNAIVTRPGTTPSHNLAPERLMCALDPMATLAGGFQFAGKLTAADSSTRDLGSTLAPRRWERMAVRNRPTQIQYRATRSLFFRKLRHSIVDARVGLPTARGVFDLV